MLALGGGSARGLAHIGVLRVLAEHGVPVRAIAGTSIGAIIGALYAAGALAQYEEFVRGLDRRSVLFFLDPVLPASGLMGGARLDRLLRSFIGERRIEQLPLPFCAVACDLELGQEVRLREGDLVAAIRASWAIPGLFTPQRLGGRWLVDGGVVAPVPLQAARALAPGPLVAVELHAHAFPAPRRRAGEPDADGDGRQSLRRLAGDPVLEPETRDVVRDALDHPGGPGQRLARRVLQVWQRREPGPDEHPPSLTSLVNDSLALTHSVLGRLQLAQDPPELAIQPRLPGIGLLDYHRAAAIIAEGERAAAAALATPEAVALLGGRGTPAR